MPKENKSTKEQLLELEKLAKRVIRKSLKNNTLDYTVQFTVSSLEPGKVKYACQISSPATGVQPITFIFDTFKDLESSLQEAEKELNKDQVEITFHQSRINSYKNKIAAHEAQIQKIEAGEVEEDDEAIPMEQV